MGRARKPFKLTPAEATAMEAARLRYLDWFKDMPKLQPKLLADLRKAARALHRALEQVHVPDMHPTFARLLVRMQIAELSQNTQRYYDNLLTSAAHTALLIDTALDEDVRTGPRRDAQLGAWIRHAAAAWRDAGLHPAPAGRFGTALAEYRAAGVPRVPNREQVRAALVQ